MKKRYFVGQQKGKREMILDYPKNATFQKYGDRFSAMIGPFYTKIGAVLMAKGWEFVTASQADKYARDHTATV